MRGVYGKGMDGFIRDELELGFRVAVILDEINAWGAEGATWWALHGWEVSE